MTKYKIQKCFKNAITKDEANKFYSLIFSEDPEAHKLAGSLVLALPIVKHYYKKICKMLRVNKINPNNEYLIYSCVSIITK